MSAHFISAQEDSLDLGTVKKTMLQLNGTLIFNKAFSNVFSKKEQEEGSGFSKTTPSDSANKLKVGFSLGADVLVFPGENFKWVFGVAFSRTSAEYHYSYHSEGKTNRFGYTDLKRVSEYEYKNTYAMLNFQTGPRKKLEENFYLTILAVVNNPIRVTKVVNGYNDAIYTNNANTNTETNRAIITDEKTVSKKGDLNLSFRLKIEYQLEFSGSPLMVSVYRNFGLIYTLPWWGLGISFTVN
jgi:hypothetical protein